MGWVSSHPKEHTPAGWIIADSWVTFGLTLASCVNRMGEGGGQPRHQMKGKAALGKQRGCAKAGPVGARGRNKWGRFGLSEDTL